jgi:hypothetical protein
MTARRSTARFPAAQGWIPRGVDGVRSARVWKRLLGVDHTVVEQVLYDEDADAVVAMVRPTRSRRRGYAVCQRGCAGYDQGEGRRRWRALDLGVVRVFLEATRPGFAAHPTGWWSPRCRGPGMGPGSPGRSRTPRRGWRSTLPGWRSPSCCGWPGAPSAESGEDASAALAIALAAVRSVDTSGPVRLEQVQQSMTRQGSLCTRRWMPAFPAPGLVVR